MAILTIPVVILSQISFFFFLFSITPSLSHILNFVFLLLVFLYLINTPSHLSITRRLFPWSLPLPFSLPPSHPSTPISFPPHAYLPSSLLNSVHFYFLPFLYITPYFSFFNGVASHVHVDSFPPSLLLSFHLFHLFSYTLSSPFLHTFHPSSFHSSYFPVHTLSFPCITHSLFSL